MGHATHECLRMSKIQHTGDSEIRYVCFWEKKNGEADVMGSKRKKVCKHNMFGKLCTKAERQV